MESLTALKPGPFDVLVEKVTPDVSGEAERFQSI